MITDSLLICKWSLRVWGHWPMQFSRSERHVALAESAIWNHESLSSSLSEPKARNWSWFRAEARPCRTQACSHVGISGVQLKSGRETFVKVEVGLTFLAQQQELIGTVEEACCLPGCSAQDFSWIFATVAYRKPPHLPTAKRGLRILFGLQSCRLAAIHLAQEEALAEAIKRKSQRQKADGPKRMQEGWRSWKGLKLWLYNLHPRIPVYSIFLGGRGRWTGNIYSIAVLLRFYIDMQPPKLTSLRCWYFQYFYNVVRHSFTAVCAP